MLLLQQKGFKPTRPQIQALLENSILRERLRTAHSEDKYLRALQEAAGRLQLPWARAAPAPGRRGGDQYPDMPVDFDSRSSAALRDRDWAVSDDRAVRLISASQVRAGGTGLAWVPNPQDDPYHLQGEPTSSHPLSIVTPKRAQPRPKLPFRNIHAFVEQQGRVFSAPAVLIQLPSSMMEETIISSLQSWGRGAELVFARVKQRGRVPSG